MTLLPLYQLGKGRVGQAFIQAVKAYATEHPGFSPEWIRIADSQGPDFRYDQSWKSVPKGILLDLTASTDTSDQLLAARNAGWGLLLANKNPLVQSQAVFDALLSGPIGLRATVGAGLPVIPEIQSLLKSGHSITQMEACLSGTLGILCSELEKGRKFSVVIREAVDQGFTEPDPRSDLTGGDVAKKILILSRLAGNRLELAAIKRESLFPAPMQELALSDFLDQLEFLDPLMDIRVARAHQKGECLRYVASYESGQCRVGLRSVKTNSPLGQLQADGKRIVIHTTQSTESIIISGAGSGPQSTAHDLMQDLFELAAII